MSLEMVLIFPLFIVFLALFWALHRISESTQLVDDASAASARAASLAFTAAQADSDARQIATAILDQSGIACRPLQINTDLSRFTAGGQVSVTVRCTVSLATLTQTGLPRTVMLAGTSTAPLDPFRAYS